MTTDIKLSPAIDLIPTAHSEADQARIATLDEALHRLWGLGRSLILAWAPSDAGMDLVVIPHYAVIEYAGSPDDDAPPSPQRAAIERVIVGAKRVDTDHIAELAELLNYRLQHVALPFRPGQDLDDDLIETVVKRYGISYCDDRAVALFDIVGFSLLSPLEQVTQLNSLAYSVNSAYAKMLNKRIDISFARTTTGDGFYIWNRDRSVQANVNLYHFMHLVLADNPIARRKSRRANMTPLLRTCFHIGSHYEFYQSEGLSPTIYSYIVGEVTIELARMSERALPGQAGQCLLGAFDKADGIEPQHVAGMAVGHGREEVADQHLAGLAISDDGIESIKCYLTGASLGGGDFGIKRYRIVDKHGRTRDVYNAKVNIYRASADPVFLGLQTEDLDRFETVAEEFAVDAA